MIVYKLSVYVCVRERKRERESVGVFYMKSSFLYHMLFEHWVDYSERNNNIGNAGGAGEDEFPVHENFHDDLGLRDADDESGEVPRIVVREFAVGQSERRQWRAETQSV